MSLNIMIHRDITVRATGKYLKKSQHIMKSDVKGYYASIDHDILFNLLQEYVPDRLVQNI